MFLRHDRNSLKAPPVLQVMAFCRFLSLIVFSSITLTACGFLGLSGGGGGSAKSVDTSGARQATLQSSLGINDLREIATPTNSDSPARSSGIQSGNGGQFLDLNTNSSLFSTPLGSSGARVDRLENAVQNMRNDFDEILPAIRRLIAIEKDIKELHGQLSTLIESEAQSAPAVPSRPTALTSSPQATQPKPAAAPKPRTIPNIAGLSVRVGDHADKTRVVFEASSLRDFTVNFDSNNQLTIAESSASFPVSAVNGLASKSKRIKSASRSDDGLALIFETTGIKAITDLKYIPPGAVSSKHRYYFDMRP